MFAQLLLALITFIGSGPVTNSPVADAPATRPALHQSPFWSVLPSNELREQLLEKLGQDPLTAADLRARLVGWEGQAVMGVTSFSGGAYRYDADDRLVEGYIVKVEQSRSRRLWGDADMQYMVTGTAQMYTPDASLAVDFEVRVKPTRHYGDGEGRAYPITGTVKWSNLRPIPYEKNVWPIPHEPQDNP